MPQSNSRVPAYIEERNTTLKDVSFELVHHAWFTLSHLLLEDNAKVLHMGCEDGKMTYTMAALNPNVNFIGIEKSSKTIRQAKKEYKLKNLSFKVGDISGDLYEAKSIDAIINSFTLHKVFSNARYNERIVSDTLRKQFTMLKDNGVMFIQDYAKPHEPEFILMEMHDEEGESDDLHDLSEVELLEWYSEHARPKQDPGCGGFFLEELTPRFPRTRLFRLPYKWAYEFIMRKDNREIWESKLPFEYTYYTEENFKTELHALGARVQYASLHWDDDYIRQNFEGHFRLLLPNGDALGDPPTSFISVSRKQPERASLNIRERRIIPDKKGELKIKTMRDQQDGKLMDVVTRDKEIAEILPYHLDEDERLYIYLHDGVVRAVSNSVPRSGENIDHREWSGHMVEAMTIDYADIAQMNFKDSDVTYDFARKNLGIDTKTNATLEEGPTYYPDPNYIDERVHSFFLHIRQTNKQVTPKGILLPASKFKEKGTIRKFNAQTILDAISVGFIPNARLELQILSLMQHLGVSAENWTSKEIQIAAGHIENTIEIQKFLQDAQTKDDRFKEVKGSAGQLRTVHSIFVEEGQSQGGRMGISAEEVDFVLSDERTVNTAVILPITKSSKGDLHAGFMTKHMPVPQRYEGNGLSISAPQFDIPKEVKNIKMLKQFIAEKFGVTPNMVLKMGESYYSHIGITPQRIHPFAIAAPPQIFKTPGMSFIPFYQYMLLWKSLSKEQHFMTVLARAYRYLPEHMKLQAKHDVKLILDDIFKSAQPDWSMPEALVAKPHAAKIAAEKKELPSTRPTPKGLTFSSHDPKNKEISPDMAEKKERMKKRFLGLAAKLGYEESSDASTDSPEAAEDVNQKKKAAEHLDLDLIAEFEREIDALRDVLDPDEEKPDLRPD